MMIEENNNDLTTFFPPLIAVRISDTLVKQGVEVYFSSFSVPIGTDTSGLRGVANLGFIDPNGVGRSKPVFLRVYITDDEAKNPDIGIHAFKLDGRVNLELTERSQDRLGNFAGYLETIIPIGDPPIAVG